jgi:hypothetical protein
MWGPIGQQRTARLFDGWNPAGLTPEQAATIVEEMNTDRGDKPPLDVWYRTFLQRPHGQLDLGLMFSHVAQAKELGFREIIIDANFADSITSPQAWVDVLDDLTPALG